MLDIPKLRQQFDELLSSYTKDSLQEWLSMADNREKQYYIMIFFKLPILFDDDYNVLGCSVGDYLYANNSVETEVIIEKNKNKVKTKLLNNGIFSDKWYHVNSYDFYTPVVIIEHFKDLITLSNQRQEEINQNINLDTTSPLYIVYDVDWVITEYRTEYNQKKTLFEDLRHDVYVRHDGDKNEIKAEDDRYLWDEILFIEKKEWSPVVKKSPIDVFVALFFTMQSAKQFILDEAHNLKSPLIYIQSAWRRDVQMNNFLNLISEK